MFSAELQDHHNIAQFLSLTEVSNLYGLFLLILPLQTSYKVEGLLIRMMQTKLKHTEINLYTHNHITSVQQRWDLHPSISLSFSWQNWVYLVITTLKSPRTWTQASFPNPETLKHREPIGKFKEYIWKKQRHPTESKWTQGTVGN